MRWALGVLACAAALWASPAARAADGQLAALSGSRLVTLNPDGSGLRTLWTAPADTPLSRPAWSPDGNRIALAVGGRIAVYDIRTGALSTLTGGPGDDDPAWLGERVAFRRGAALLSVAADGSDPRTFGLALDLGATRVSFAPDGLRVAVVLPPALQVAGLDGLGGALLTTGVRGAPAWSADSARIAYSGAGSVGALRIYTLSPPQLTATPVSPDGGVDTAPAFSPGGTQIAYVHQGAELDVAGPAGTSTVLAGAFTDPAWQPCTAATVSCVSVAAPVCAALPSVTMPAGHAVTLHGPVCTDPGGRPLTVSVVEAPQHGTLADARYTPAAGFTGQDAVAYQASNGLLASNVVRQAIFVVAQPVVPASAPPSRAPFLNARRAPRLDRRGRAALRASCDAPCRVSLRLVVRKRFKSRLVRRSLRAGQVVTLRFKLTRRPKRRIKSAWIVGTVRDAAGRKRAVRLPVTPPR